MIDSSQLPSMGQGRTLFGWAWRGNYAEFVSIFKAAEITQLSVEGSKNTCFGWTDVIVDKFTKIMPYKSFAD